MADAFFMPTEDPRRFVGTRHTSGPWDAASQHGGPPAALLAREIERLPSTVDGIARVARLTVEILGPVPVGEVVLSARVVRPGRSVELVEAELGAGGRPVLIARAWRIRRAELGLPTGLQARDQPPALPSAAAVFDDPGSRWGYLNAMEWRFASGDFEREGPSQVWARQRVPLIEGEPPSPLQRLVTLADSGNGLSRLFDWRSWLFINTELTVHLYQQPSGEWMFVSAHTMLGDDGVGLAKTEMFDRSGRIGSGAQTLLVSRR